MAVTINASTSAGLVQTADTSGVLALQTAGTTAVSISSGQVATFAQAPVLPAASIPQAALAAGVAGNGPLFLATGTTQSAPSSSVDTKIVFGTEVTDTNSNYNPSTSRFQPTVAGYYDIKSEVQISGTQASGTYLNLSLFKNGSQYLSIASANSQAFPQMVSSVIVYLNGSSDYVEVYQFQAGTPLPTSNIYFQGFLARSA